MSDDALAAAANVYEATVLADRRPAMSAVCPKCNGRDFDYITSECLDCADAARFAELEATIRLLEAENARLKTELGAASFVAGERARNGIVRWLDEMSRDCDHVGLTGGALIRDLSRRIAACEDINPP